MAEEKALGAFGKPKRRMRVNEYILHGMLKIIPQDSTIIDIGAGNGGYVKVLRKNGYRADGIDGIPNIEEQTKGLVKWCNLTNEIPPSYKRYWEWGLFLEVGEHIPSLCEKQVIDNVAMLPRDGLIVSWAKISQRGLRHVNCRTQVYIASEFAKRGWFVDEEATILIRDCLYEDANMREKIMVLKEDENH